METSWVAVSVTSTKVINAKNFWVWDKTGLLAQGRI
jgi:hypothetical protein